MVQAVTCITRENLLRFYGNLDVAFRALIHYRVLTDTGRPFDYFIYEDPQGALEVLHRALGPHNATLFVELLLQWLEGQGCRPAPEEAARLRRLGRGG